MITLEILKSLQVDTIISACETNECSQYRSVFKSKAEKIGEDHEQHEAFVLLSYICSMHLKQNRDNQPPFVPLFVSRGKRTFLPEDLSTDQEIILKDFVILIDDAELKSRIADLLWTRRCKGKFEFAKQAIDSYIKSAIKLASANKNSSVARFSRAIDISKELGQPGEGYTKTIITEVYNILSHQRLNK